MKLSRTIPATPGGLLHHLFSVRTLGLFDRAGGPALASRLSGLLIGEELRAQARVVIDPAGPRCYCGANGCVETFISGAGLERRFFEASGKSLDVRAIFAGATEDDTACKAAVDEFYARFGQSVANLLAVLDPDIVVLGGGLSNVEGLYTRGVEEVGKRVFSDELTTPIVPNQLGDSAGVIGAALVGAWAQTR
jgi:predicted NBD/HSP70 family sugar kinase